MTDHPEPLVPAEVDLRDFAYLPLDVLRLRDSDLASVEDAEVFRCAVLSWCVAWHQVPAASMPDDDGLLARLLGFGRDVRGWKRIRAAGGMRGWITCSDGRLYHPVVAEKALAAWRSKLEQRWKTEAARVKKHNQRHKLEGDAAVQMPEFEEWMSHGCPQGQALPVPGTEHQRPEGHTGDVPTPVPRETASKRREGKGREGIPIETSSLGGGKPPRPTRKPPADFVVTDPMRMWAREKTPMVLVDSETDRFRDHTFANPITDWPGAWRNWMRKAQDFAASRRNPATGSQATVPAAESVEEYQARMDAEREAERRRLENAKPSPDVMARLAELAGGMRTP